MFKRKSSWVIFFVIVLWNRLPGVFAADPLVTSEQLPFLHDISISVADVEAPADIILNKTIRIYATVHNDSDKDIKGVVRFYNERLKAVIGVDQPFSAVARGTDVVFIDVVLNQLGETPVAVRIIPENSQGDNPANNKVTGSMIVDRDSDKDGIGNRRDPDDDNDRVPDKSDDFPLDPKESEDTDKDNVGNNADPDDDNDRVPDTKDTLPTNHGPVLIITAGGGGGGSSYRFTYDTSTDNTSTDNNTSPNNVSAPSITSPLASPAASPVFSPGGSRSPESSKPSSVTPLSVSSAPPASKPKVGEVMTFDASKSYDPDGKIVTVKWDFGDGEVKEGMIVNHHYQKSGDYLITLTLADDKGETRQETIKIQVGQKITPWVIGLFVILLIVSLRLFWKQHALQKRLSKKRK